MRVSLPCLVLGAALALSSAQAAPSVYVAYPRTATGCRMTT
ncbi:hypothetical protein [Deinococcus multiflagellatus]|uniref:Uncharacterized protein n=1 Tax=Deinococcus multiflagellatus TaxID=1656887 RepID=A0ABW1ZP75_9DEIO